MRVEIVLGDEFKRQFKYIKWLVSLINNCPNTIHLPSHPHWREGCFVMAFYLSHVSYFDIFKPSLAEGILPL